MSRTETSLTSPDGGSLHSRGVQRIPLAVLFVNIALAGNNALVAALLYRTTGSASQFALILVSNFAIAAVVQLVAGHVVDRIGARRVAVLSETLACAAIVLEAAVALLDSPVFLLTCGAALVSVVQAFYRAAMFTLAPLLAGKERVAALNARINASFQAGTLLGTPIGTLLLFVEPSWGFLALAGSFGVAAVILKSLPSPPDTPAAATAAAPQKRRKVGIVRELRGQRGLIAHIVLCSGDYVAVYLFTLILVPLVGDRFGGSTTTLAVVNSALPVGVMLSGLLPWRSYSRERTLRLVAASMVALIGVFSLLTVDLGVPVTVLCVALVGLAAGSSQTLLMTALQLRSPAHLLGRVASLRLFVASALATPTLAGATSLLHAGAGWALAFCAGVEALYLGALLLLSNQRLLGADTLAAPRTAD